MSAFTALPLTKPMIENLENLGYQEMTPVQAGSLPYVIKGEDLCWPSRSLWRIRGILWWVLQGMARFCFAMKQWD
ncbi:hypothetical protein [Desulfobacula sp.]|uniref:hypothetical protein n=1 Tax=Desulfobacula sp. TaxID=2593537 RepID=UPI0039B9A15F